VVNMHAFDHAVIRATCWTRRSIARFPGLRQLIRNKSVVFPQSAGGRNMRTGLGVFQLRGPHGLVERMTQFKGQGGKDAERAIGGALPIRS